MYLEMIKTTNLKGRDGHLVDYYLVSHKGCTIYIMQQDW